MCRVKGRETCLTWPTWPYVLLLFQTNASKSSPFKQCLRSQQMQQALHFLTLHRMCVLLFVYPYRLLSSTLEKSSSRPLSLYDDSCLLRHSLFYVLPFQCPLTAVSFDKAFLAFLYCFLLKHTRKQTDFFAANSFARCQIARTFKTGFTLSSTSMQFRDEATTGLIL